MSLSVKNTLGGGGNPEGSYVWKKYEPTPDPYLSFLGNNEFRLATYNKTKNWDGTLEYSTDTTTWNTWDGVTEISSSGNNLYLRGTGNTVITGNSSDNSFCFVSIYESGSLRISCEGNIENLLDYETVAAGNHPLMGSHCFAYLFDYSSHVVNSPELPATTLAEGCYAGMFRYCSNLLTLPELPATTLADGCYTNMFQNCTSICVSSTQTGKYQTIYRIPTSGTGTVGTNSLTDMFIGTLGTFTGTPEINMTYYYYGNTLN